MIEVSPSSSNVLCMALTRTFFILSILSLSSRPANCHFLNQPCYSNADCLIPNSRCNKPQGAPKGLCLCPPGYDAVGRTACILTMPHGMSRHYLKAAPLLPAFPNSALGNICSLNSDCTTIDPNSICQRTPLLCKQPISYCVCQKGSIADQGRCKKTASFGQSCGNGTLCTDPRTTCNPVTRICTCDSASKVHPDIETRCVSAKASADYDMECYNDVDCYDGFECLNEKCICKVGQRYDYAHKHCVANEIGDDCSGNDDCYAIKFSICSGETSTCDCLPRYNRSVVSMGGSPKSVCLPNPKTSRQLGESCDDDESSMTRNFCRPPFVCSSCSPDGAVKVCAMPPLAPEAVDGTTAVATTTKPVPATTKAQVLLNDFCELDADCSEIPNAVCDPNTETCICKKGYIQEDNFACTSWPELAKNLSSAITTPSTMPKGTTGTTVIGILGQDCSIDADCSDYVEHAICDPYADLPTCICEDGYIPLGLDSCKPSGISPVPLTTKAPVQVATTKVVAIETTTTTVVTIEPLQIGDSCEEDSDCSSVQHAICNDVNECSCDAGYTSNDDVTCIVEVTTTTAAPGCRNNVCDFGAKCRLGVDSCKTDGGVCYNFTCQCPQGTKYGMKDDCIDNRRRARVGEMCEDSRDCMYDLVCDTYQCTCTSGYKTIGDYDCWKRKIGDDCTYDSDCRYVKDGICLHRKCSCDTNYYAKSPEECAISIWVETEAIGTDTAVPCGTDIDCVGPGVPMYSICGPRGFCQCPSHAYLDEDQRCKYRMASDFTGWACAQNSDCGNGYVCRKDECRKISIMSTAAKRSLLSLKLTVLLASLIISL